MHKKIVRYQQGLYVQYLVFLLIKARITQLYFVH
nr:MAG TPA: hypothetical protein [Caudoviricetes sp.]DAX36040.1 MAG TPA: hypothetical protein [Caudoviricetes sp.]DAY25087.1 MAG TPA: hypothetical protein [Caudoviricetes sp.]